MWLKWWYTFIISMFVISAAYGSSCLSGGLSTVNNKYHVLTEVSTLTVSLMVIGFCVGPLLWAPMSEEYGRRPTYFISFGLYVIFNIPVPCLQILEDYWFAVSCVVFFASSALSIAGASLVDMHNDTRGLALSFFSFCPYSGPVISLIVNGFIATDTERMDLIIWVNMAFAGVMWIMVSLMPETYAPVILKRRAKN